VYGPLKLGGSNWIEGGACRMINLSVVVVVRVGCFLVSIRK